jgi:hypothetical protein
MSSTATIKFDHFVSISDCAKLIATVGEEVTVLVEGEPGCGKTSLLSYQAEKNGDKWRKPGDYFASDEREYVYVDCPEQRDGDIITRIPDRDTKTLVQYITGLINLNDPRPKVIMLDEIGKVPKSMKPMYTRWILERFIGDSKLPEKSIIFATTNNASDGVGDSVEAHVGNRLMRIKLRKPSYKEWVVWATDNGISPLSRSWAALNTRAFASYLEAGQEENPFIFSPRRGGTAQFYSPRSATKADVIIKRRAALGEQLTMAALCGTVGNAAGESLAVFFEMEKDIIQLETIIKSPETCHVPTAPGALLMTLFNAVDKLDTQDEVSACMKWVKRIESSEIQAVFFTMLVQSKRTARMAMRNDIIKEWSKDNFEIMS